MGYGDGDGVVLGDLTLSLDVAGHEMTHGVTSSTSQLIYMDESGALNEAFSDFFGVAIAARARSASPDWAIGKEIFLNEKREEGLRNLKDPASLMARYLTEEGNFEKRPYPSRVSEKFESFGPCDRRNDRCYVHVNSMIPARAMVLISDVLGMEQAEKLMYLVLTQFMTPMSQFDDFESQTMAACRTTLPEEDCLKVRQALSEVGF
jgi:Zn-dependent metalloprotease